METTTHANRSSMVQFDDKTSIKGGTLRAAQTFADCHTIVKPGYEVHYFGRRPKCRGQQLAMWPAGLNTIIHVSVFGPQTEVRILCLGIRLLTKPQIWKSWNCTFLMTSVYQKMDADQNS